MLIVRWLAVWDTRENARTEIQVFPAAKHVAAPYPVHCRLVLLGEASAKPITIEGAKVNQPISVCLGELFPGMMGCYGVLVELLPTRRSLDLTLSRCQIERRTSDRTVRYCPWALPVLSKPARHNPGELKGVIKRKAFPLTVEPQTRYSLLSVNVTGEAMPVKVDLLGARLDGAVERLDSGAVQGERYAVSVSSQGCLELPLLCNEGKSMVSLPEPRNDDVAVYLVSRDVAHGGITEISSF